MKIIRPLIHVICICAVLFGFIGFFASGFPPYKSFERYEQSPTPLHGNAGVCVDREGRLYYGADQFDTIQVFNDKGEFLYGFSFPTRQGMFAFYLDDNNHVKVVTARGDYLYTFDNGELLAFENCEDDAAFSEYQRLARQHEYFDSAGRRYDTTNRYAVMVFDTETDQLIRVVVPQAPKWPWPVMLYWLIAALGAGVFVLINRKAIQRALK